MSPSSSLVAPAAAPAAVPAPAAVSAPAAAAPVNPLDDLAGLSFGGAAASIMAANAFQSAVPHHAAGNDLYAQPMKSQPQAANPFAAPAAGMF